MNSCILLGRIVESPEVRYTQDNQTPIAETRVEFDGLRADDPPTSLRVVGWGNLSSEIKENYAKGDRVIIEGRLRMNTVERPEGFKEKRAELWVSRIHKVGQGGQREQTRQVQAMTSSPPPPINQDLPLDNDVYKPLVPEASPPTPSPVSTPTITPPPTDKDLDDIPF